jgi:hypothetical protein
MLPPFNVSVPAKVLRDEIVPPISTKEETKLPVAVHQGQCPILPSGTLPPRDKQGGFQYRLWMSFTNA